MPLTDKWPVIGRHWPASLLLLLTCLIYLPGLDGPWLYDDRPNLLNNPHLTPDAFNLTELREAATSSGASRLGRPLSMLSFAANFSLSGNTDAYGVKLTNLILHLVTGLAIYLLVLKILEYLPARTLIQSRMTALFCTGLWLLHPLQVSTVLYAIQRMTQLSALFTLTGCLVYLWLRGRTLALNRGYALLMLSVGIFTVLAVLSKENGALLPVFLLLLEWLVFRFRFHPASHRTSRLMVIAPLAGSTIVILVYLLWTYTHLRGTPLPTYFFTLDERLLSQGRALMHYLGWLLLLNPEPMTLYHDDFLASRSLLEPLTTLFSLISVTGLILLAFHAMAGTRYRLVGFGLLWFFCGHLLESTTIPLLLVMEHRNYLPSFGIFLGLAESMRIAWEGMAGHPTRRLLLGLILCAVPVFLLQERVHIWSNEREFVRYLLENKPGAAWAWAEASDMQTRGGQYGNAIVALRQAVGLDKTEAAYVFGQATNYCLGAPTQVFPEELSAELETVMQRPLRITPVTVNSFNMMAAVCGRTSTNAAILSRVYEQAVDSGDVDISRTARRALDAIEKSVSR